jgi:hypothetical protein
MSSEYVAGSCNIGKGEIRRRQIVALFGIFLTISSATALFNCKAYSNIALSGFKALADWEKTKCEK